MEEALLRGQIVDRMTLIETHVESRAAHGLLDVTPALEVLYREILNLSRGWELRSTNFPKRDFPAIDLHDEARRIAVQVSVSVDKRKIEKTQEIFLKHKLLDKYDQLVFVGIKGARDPKALKPWAQKWDQAQILNLDGLLLQQLEDLDDRLSRSVRWHEFVDKGDEHCFQVVLRQLNRDAIRHAVNVEGDFSAMIAGLSDIKQIITRGEIDGKALKAKPITSYGIEYQEILEDIDVSIGRMKSLVQRNLTEYQILPYKTAELVDEERRKVVDRVNAFCAARGLSNRIEIWTG